MAQQSPVIPKNPAPCIRKPHVILDASKALCFYTFDLDFDDPQDVQLPVTAPVTSKGRQLSAFNSWALYRREQEKLILSSIQNAPNGYGGVGVIINVSVVR